MRYCKVIIGLLRVKDIQIGINNQVDCQILMGVSHTVNDHSEMTFPVSTCDFQLKLIG